MRVFIAESQCQRSGAYADHTATTQLHSFLTELPGSAQRGLSEHSYLHSDHQYNSDLSKFTAAGPIQLYSGHSYTQLYTVIHSEYFRYLGISVYNKCD
jgi:hypothetical protein